MLKYIHSDGFSTTSYTELHHYSSNHVSILCQAVTLHVCQLLHTRLREALVNRIKVEVLNQLQCPGPLHAVKS